MASSLSTALTKGFHSGLSQVPRQVCVFKYLLGIGGADDHLDRIARFQESLERRDVRARWVANEHASGQMNDFCAIFEHLVCGVFDVAARATIASRESDQFKSLILR